MNNAIDLGLITEGKVRNLSGHERGLAARKNFHLDDLDLDGSKHVVRVPREIYGISPSFVQGFFAGTLKRFGNDLEKFHQAYQIDGSDLIQRQIDRGLQNIVIDRSSPLL